MAVIDLVGGCCRQRQRFGRDVGQRCGGIAHAVVAGQFAIRTVEQIDAADAHGLAGAGVLGGKRRAGRAGADALITADKARQGVRRNAGGRCAVVDLVVSAGAGAQGFGRYFCRRRATGTHRIVAAHAIVASVGQRDASDGHRIGADHILAVESGAG